MNVALYARVSTRDKGQDTENQLEQLRRYCKKRDWTVVGEYVDQKSGATSERPDFKRMFAAAGKRRKHPFEQLDG